MDFKLKKDYNRNGKIIKAGQTLEVTQELFDYLEENGYDKKVKKEKKKKEDSKESENI